MRILLDTHAWLWFVEGDEKLSTHALTLIQDPANDVFVSRVSFFEAAIKTKIGKLDLSKSLEAILLDTYRSGLRALELTDAHVVLYPAVPFDEGHRDPFDRMLLTTAFAENLAFVTRDVKFQAYQNLIQLIW